MTRTIAIFAVKKCVFGLLLVLWCSSAYACSTFCLSERDEVVCGRNMDYRFGGGLITVNPRGLVKTAIPASISDPTSNTPAKWTSRYGSVTFSLAGRELPNSGVNERGLVVNAMTLHEATYPSRDSRREVVPLQWIQYQLDTCATVSEVLATDKKIRPGNWELYSRGHHFLLTDRSGMTAAVEYIDGRTVVHTGDSLPVKAMTNSIYEASLAHLLAYRGFGGEKEIERGSASLSRFVRLGDVLKRRPLFPVGAKRIDRAFDILDDVAAGKNTVWSIVYDVNEATVYYRTHVQRKVRIINFGDLDFEAIRCAKVLAIDNQHHGNVSRRFVDSTTTSNRAFLEECMRNEGITLDDWMTKQLEFLARYPDTFLMDSKSPD